MSSEQSTVLNCEQVSFAYGAVEVLSAISCEVAAGKILGLLGPNGSGKSTLMRLMSGVRVPRVGRVIYDGRDLRTHSRDELARAIAVVPQETAIELPFSVLEVVLMGRSPYLGKFGFESAHDLAVAQQAMEHTGVAGLATREVHALSGGERQRVILARALAQEPRVLLLDEPTAFLDIKHQVAVYDLMKQLSREQGLAVVAILHDLNLAALYCDRLMLLKAGHTFCQGTPEQVLTYANIKSVYETEVYIDLNDLTGKVQILPLDADTRRRLEREEPTRR
ncbi:MAG: heme ABC transporter ATP-binding protein [Deltaproteobacteria bacterium]|nr:heme ABC transporter ATP-binding protein [Deltaproteobacteria bacterium]